MQSAVESGLLKMLTCKGKNLKLTTNIDKDAMEVLHSDHKGQY